MAAMARLTPPVRALPEPAIADSIHALMRGVLHDLQPKLEEQGLTMGRFWALHLISNLEAPSLTRVARHLSVSGPTACATVDGLEAAGLIWRRRSATDRRIVELAPTAAGRRAESAVWREIGRALAEATEGIAPAELSTTARTLATIAGRLGRTGPETIGRGRRA
ncbi:MAG TPA: MarR family transcriptional regulator [Thermoplasmata archaeon]|nr:MarR family transcriptional regulator [Thermoplasmata archaeon]